LQSGGALAVGNRTVHLEETLFESNYAKVRARRSPTRVDRFLIVRRPQ
jgi:hypothetical protein